MKILIEKAVVEQALDYLENSHARFYEEREKAITALREALAEQAEQEPVAYVFLPNGELLYPHELERTPDADYEPLYAAPVRTKDMTDDELDILWCSNRARGDK